jgi:hypothetical protein
VSPNGRLEKLKSRLLCLNRLRVNEPAEIRAVSWTCWRGRTSPDDWYLLIIKARIEDRLSLFAYVFCRRLGCKVDIAGASNTLPDIFVNRDAH